LSVVWSQSWWGIIAKLGECGRRERTDQPTSAQPFKLRFNPSEQLYNHSPNLVFFFLLTKELPRWSFSLELLNRRHSADSDPSRGLFRSSRRICRYRKCRDSNFNTSWHVDLTLAHSFLALSLVLSFSSFVSLRPVGGLVE
jgi:hypothetical protein